MVSGEWLVAGLNFASDASLRPFQKRYGGSQDGLSRIDLCRSNFLNSVSVAPALYE